jgi:hypothetical protein
MAQTKIITPGSQDFHEPVATLVKVSSRGLIGNDLRDFVKRASARFTHKIASMHLPPGEELIHLLAVGATEAYGPNRNGDGFKEAHCIKCHPTFQKYARWYRDHQNKDLSKGRGIIRDSDFNPEMRRIELLVGLHRDKKAAERNGGLVADEELEALDRGEDIPVSMACKVAFDVCSSCGNKAKTRKEYCGPEMCKHGGCRDNLGKTFEDGHTLHVDNPDPMFFDISKVFRNADRIAFTLGKAAAYEELCKAASVNFGSEYGGAALAEQIGVAAPLWLPTDGPWTSPRIVGQLKIASALMQQEDEIEKLSHDTLDLAYDSKVQPVRGDIPDGHHKLAQVMSALSSARCMLPVGEFLVLMSGSAHEKIAELVEDVAARLPGVFNRLALDPQLEDKLEKNPYRPEGIAPMPVREWAIKRAKEWSVDRPRVVERLQLATIRGASTPPTRRETVKVASVDRAEELAQEYARYQLAFLHATADLPGQEFRNELVIRANHRN